MPEVTREQLVGALQEFHLWVTPDRDQTAEATGLRGTVQNPEAMADGLLLALRANAAHEADGEPDDLAGHLERAIKDGLTGPDGFVVPAVTAGKVLGIVMGALALHEGNRQQQATAAADPELDAIGVILGLLDSLAGESGAGEPSSVRVLTYIASRYGFVLADEED